MRGMTRQSLFASFDFFHSKERESVEDPSVRLLSHLKIGVSPRVARTAPRSCSFLDYWFHQSYLTLGDLLPCSALSFEQIRARLI